MSAAVYSGVVRRLSTSTLLLALGLGLPTAGTAWQRGPRVHQARGLFVGLDPADPAHFVVVALASEPAFSPEACETPVLRESPVDPSGTLELSLEHGCPVDRTEVLNTWSVRACTLTREPPARISRIVLRAEGNRILLEAPPKVPGQAAFVTADIAGRTSRHAYGYTDLQRLVSTPGRRGPGWPACLERLPALRIQLAAEAQAEAEARARAQAQAATAATTDATATGF